MKIYKVFSWQALYRNETDYDLLIGGTFKLRIKKGDNQS
jgi:hypothetical protein